MDIEKLLHETLELSDFQVQVYLSLLEKTGTAGQLFRRLNINRATLYRVLDELVFLNLVIKKETGKRMFFEAMHPSSLNDLYTRKKIAIEEKGVALQRAVYELLRKATSKPTDASITIEKGVYAHYRSMKMQLASKEKILRMKIDTAATLYDYMDYPETGSYLEFQRQFIKEHDDKGILTKMLFDNPIDPKRPLTKIAPDNDSRMSRYLPEEILKGISFKVFDDYTMLTLHDKNPENLTIITIRNTFTAQLMKSLFDYVFDRSIAYYAKSPIPAFKTRVAIELPVLGIGTSGVGGYWNGMHPYIDDVGDVDQLRHAIGKGVFYIDCCLMYGDGHAVELVAKAIKNVPRDNLFLNGKLTRIGGKLVGSIREVEEQCNRYLKILGTDYLDQFQIHSPKSIAISQEDVIGKIGELITAGKVRNFGVSNYSKEELIEAGSIIKEPIVSNEIPFGVYTRTYEHNGTLDYMYKQNISTISYFTIRKGGLLVEFDDEKNMLNVLAKKYQKTPSQIAINWVVNHPRTMALIKATNGTHVNENVGAVGWKMEEEDYQRINKEFLPLNQYNL